MRRVLWLALPLTALLSVSVTAQNPPTAETIDKIKLTFTDPARLWVAIPAVPTGISGVLVYPLDKSLIVRGTAAAIEEMKAALRGVDVPGERDRQTVTLRRGNPKAVRTAALALPQAGMVQVQGNTLTFSGNEDWLHAVRGLVFGAELTHPGPRPGGLSTLGPGSLRPAPVPDYVEAVLPDGRKVEFRAADVTLQDGQHVKVWMPIIDWMPLRNP
jgi:hypothetical protein